MLKIYFVINEEEGKIHFASEDKIRADAKAEELTQASMIDEAEDLDMEFDELDEDELADLAFTSGFNGGAYSVFTTTVNVSDVAQLIDDNDTILEVTEDIRISYSELFELLAESESVDSFGIDGEFVSFSGEFGNGFEGELTSDDDFEDFDEDDFFEDDLAEILGDINVDNILDESDVPEFNDDDFVSFDDADFIDFGTE